MINKEKSNSSRMNTDKKFSVQSTYQLNPNKKSPRSGQQQKKSSVILYNPKKKNLKIKNNRKSYDPYVSKKSKKSQGLMENYIQKLHESQGKSKNDLNALRSMLNNCCHLMGSIPDPKMLKRKLKQESPDKNKTAIKSRRRYQIVEKKFEHEKVLKDKIQKEIQDHNRRYKRQRSSSLNGKKKDQSNKKKNYDLRNSKRNNSAFIAASKLSNFDRGEKKRKGNLMSSIKGMSKNIMNTFKRKPVANPTSKKELSSSSNLKHCHYQCECNSNSTFKKLNWESTSICKRLISVLKFKYSPNSAHISLKREFQELAARKNLCKKIKDQIRKDVDRTYSDNEFLSSKISRQGIQSVLECIALKIPEIGYVQGMNFIIATAYYHCDVYYSYGVFLTVFEMLDMRDIFLPKLPGLTRHFSVIDTLILLKLKDVYSQFAKHRVTVEFFCTDWIMCLGMNVIPLEYSGVLLSYLSEYGWNYFYRLIIYYLKCLEKRIIAQNDQADLLNLLKMLRNGKRQNGEILKISWSKLLHDSLYISIDDDLVNKLVGNSNYFKPCPSRQE